MDNENLIFIVVDKNAKVETEIATKLRNILNATGKCNSVLWGLKEYRDNEPILHSKQKVIFLGINEISRRNESSISQWKFQWNNLRYGWIGNIAVITMTEHKNYSDDEFKIFKSMCEKHKIEVSNETLAEKLFDTSTLDGLVTTIIAHTVLSPIALINHAISAYDEAINSRDSQYTFLVNEFILSGFSEYFN
jgi:hypothetical protein